MKGPSIAMQQLNIDVRDALVVLDERRVSASYAFGYLWVDIQGAIENAFALGIAEGVKTEKMARIYYSVPLKEGACGDTCCVNVSNTTLECCGDCP